METLRRGAPRCCNDFRDDDFHRHVLRPARAQATTPVLPVDGVLAAINDFRLHAAAVRTGQLFDQLPDGTVNQCRCHAVFLASFCAHSRRMRASASRSATLEGSLPSNSMMPARSSYSALASGGQWWTFGGRVTAHLHRSAVRAMSGHPTRGDCDTSSRNKPSGCPPVALGRARVA